MLQLKARLEKLGVHIDAPAVCNASPKREKRSEAAGLKGADTSWESHLDRSSHEVAQLLDRCNRVHQALNKSADTDGEEPPATKPIANKAAAAVAAARAAAAAAAGTKHSRTAARSASSSSSSAAAAATAVAAAAAARASPSKDSKLLVRAAQRLLRNAQAEAEQVDRALTVAAAAAPERQAPAAAAIKKPSAAVSADRGSPLATVLAQYKEAQAAWAQDKAKLRREAVSCRKQAGKLELELAKLQRLHQHKTLDVSSLRAALKGRDLLLEEAQARSRQLEEALAKSQEVAAEKLCSLAAERDDLQALLLATLQRLEGVEAVVAAADATSAALEEKVRVLEGERHAALELAAASKAEVVQLQEAQRRLQWQSQLLEKMSEVQLRHNKRKSAAIKELLSTAGTGEHSSGGAAAGKHSSSSPKAQGKHRSPGNPSQVLQGLLDELLATDDDEDGDGSAGAAGRGGFADDSTLFSESVQ